MIKLTEMRIGNWVNGRTEENPYPFQIEPHHFQSINIEKTLPIPLTPQILEKCGLTYNGGDAQKFESDFIDLAKSTDYPGRFIVYGILKKTGNNKCLYIDHLHQLQNLYFTLSGKELSVNPSISYTPHSHKQTPLQ